MNKYIGYISFDGREGILVSCFAENTDQAWEIIERFSEVDAVCIKHSGCLSIVQQSDSIKNINK